MEMITLNKKEAVQISSKLFGLNTIYRKRKYKVRYGFKSSDCFYQIHFGKRSYYVEKPYGLRKMNVSIKEVN